MGELNFFMKKLIYSVLVLVGFSLVSGMAKECSSEKCCTQDPDCNQWKIATVKWVNSKESWKTDDKEVVLIGKIVKKQDEDTYLLDDGTGVIELDSDLALPEGKRVVVHGRIDYAFIGERATEFNVRAWRLESQPGKLNYKK